MSGIIKRILTQRKLARWNDTPKDLVILHCFGRDKTLPSASPFVMKAHTYLRATGIPYKIDGKDSFGPKGKAPWISLNGEHVSDSEHILAYLNRKFDKNLDKGHSKEKLAFATAVRIMLEDQFTWGMALERFVYNPNGFKKVFGTGSPFYDSFILTLGGYTAQKRANAQGIGLHSREEIEQFIFKNLRAVSSLMGDKKFILGDQLCQDDCAIFGALAQTVWGLPDSKYEKLVHDELTNLKDYCFRIKELYYPDWDQLTSRKKRGGGSGDGGGIKIKKQQLV